MNVFHLKLIALTTMIIDHIGLALFPEYIIFRLIGRLAFPIYAFLISEGIKHTKNIESYLKRLLVFSIISQFFYSLLFYGNINFFQNTNTIYTLFLATLSIYLYSKTTNIFLKIICLLLGIIFSIILKTDYSYMGVLLVYIFYFLGNNPIYGLFWIIFKDSSSFITLSNIIISGNLYMLKENFILKNLAISICTLIPFFLIYFYNNKKGRKLKYIFYIAYPLHLFVIYLITLKF